MLTFSILSWVTLRRTATVRLRGAEQHGIVGVSLHVLFEILGTFESFTAEVALVRLQRNVDTDVRGDVVPLDSGGAAIAPLAGKVQVVSALATDMALANVILLTELVSSEQREHVLKGLHGATRRTGVMCGRAARGPSEKRVRLTYVELFCGRQPLATVLPLTDELVARAGGD